MEQRKLKPVPTSATYGMTPKPPVVSLVMEEELAKMIQDCQSVFTKSETVFENNQVSVTRVIDPLVNLYRGEFIVNEMFVATLNEEGRYKYAISSGQVIYRPGEEPDNREIRKALVKCATESWGVRFGK